METETNTITKTYVTKLIVAGVVGTGVTKIVQQIIENNVAPPTKKIDKITMVAGAVVLGMMAADASRAYTGARIDHYVAQWQEFRGVVEKVTEEPTPEAS